MKDTGLAIYCTIDNMFWAIFTVVSVCSIRISHVMGKPEWDKFRFVESQPLLVDRH